ncbi:MAG: hypothetical protein FJ194_01265 [Gammaproteobacteria bacterium]|nr:hypothetical protein [Gammaproteobacteria bacterium]
MLRTNTFAVTTTLIGSLITFSSVVADAATPDFAEVCYQATLEPPELKITDRIMGYCTTAITAAQNEVARAGLLNNRAILHLKMKNRAAARVDLDEALRLHPGSAPVRVTLSHLHWLEGNLTAADEVLTQRVQGDAPPQLLINRSIIRRTRGDSRGALEDAMQVAGFDADTIHRLTPETAPIALPSPSANSAGADVPTPAPSEEGLQVPDEPDPEDEDINRD